MYRSKAEQIRPEESLPVWWWEKNLLGGFSWKLRGRTPFHWNQRHHWLNAGYCSPSEKEQQGSCLVWLSVLHHYHLLPIFRLEGKRHKRAVTMAEFFEGSDDQEKVREKNLIWEDIRTKSSSKGTVVSLEWGCVSQLGPVLGLWIEEA